MTAVARKPRSADPNREIVPKAEQSRRTRDLVIATGIHCLARYGYAQTTLLLIANEAGVSRGPLNYHFRDKNDLMAAIAEALPRQAPSEMRERLARITDVQERLIAVVDIALDEHTGDHHFAAIELLIAARNDPGLAESIGPHFDSGESTFDAWWIDYFQGLTRSREDLLAFRHVAVACLRGLALDHILHKDQAAHARAISLFRTLFLAMGVSGEEERGQSVEGLGASRP